MSAAGDFERIAARAEGGALKGEPLDLASRAAADRSAMQRLIGAARKHVAATPRARSFRHYGRVFRLHQFDGWLIVMTWRGLPIAGPFRTRSEVTE